MKTNIEKDDEKLDDLLDKQFLNDVIHKKDMENLTIEEKYEVEIGFDSFRKDLGEKALYPPLKENKNNSEKA